MNHRITLLRRAVGKDAAGQPTEDWVPLPQIWADVRFPTGAAVLRAGSDATYAAAEVAVTKASIRVRSRADIAQGMRVTYGSWTFKIQNVLPDTDRSFMFLVVESVR